MPKVNKTLRQQWKKEIAPALSEEINNSSLFNFIRGQFRSGLLKRMLDADVNDDEINRAIQQKAAEFRQLNILVMARFSQIHPVFGTLAGIIMHQTAQITHRLQEIFRQRIHCLTPESIFEDNIISEEIIAKSWQALISDGMAEYKIGKGTKALQIKIQQLIDNNGFIANFRNMETACFGQVHNDIDANKPCCFPGLLAELVIGIAKNSRDAGAGYVDISLSDESDHFQITITDNGSGLDENFLSKLYHAPVESTKGTSGQWCYICGNLIKSMGGSIYCQKKQKGTGLQTIIKIPYQVDPAFISSLQ